MSKKSNAVESRAKRKLNSESWSVIMRLIAVFAVLIIAAVGGYGLYAALTKPADRNIVDLEYGSVSTPVKDGEIYEEGADYSAIDIFARLNWTFAQQKQWYGEYHGKVHTVVEQDVQTYKYYKDGMLLSADLTKSSIVSGASQFCYLKDADRVLWRKPVGGPSTYNKMDTEWKTGEPYRNMTISGENGFKANNGLPAYELSVYVIEENTVLSSSVEKLEDGRFKVTFVMNPETWTETDENGVETVKGANAYYANQMMFTGGLSDTPVFSALTVAFTFDENWYTYKSEVEEAYSAIIGPIKADATADGTTEYQYYEYDDEHPYPSAYEDYFKYWIDAQPDNDPAERELTAIDCLAGAFGPILEGPASLHLDLGINGEKLAGDVFLDLSKANFEDFDISALEARFKLGALGLWVEEGKAYLSYGGAKLSLGLNDLISLIGGLAGGSEVAAEGLDLDALLGALANGDFIATDKTAELHTVLPLAGLEIPVDFYFCVDEEKNVTLDRADIALNIADTSITASVSFGEEVVPALTAQEKSAFTEAMPYIDSLVELFTSDTYHAEVAYTGDGFAVSGAIEIAREPFTVNGVLDLVLTGDPEVVKSIAFAYADSTIYVNLDGIKLKAGIKEGLALIGRYFDLNLGDTDLDIGAIVCTVLSPDFAENFASSEEGSALRILLKGTELLKAFGIDFALGDAELSVKQGELSASVLGIHLTLTAEHLLEVDTVGYTDIVPYAEQIADIIAGGFLSAEIAYSSETLQVAGTLDFDISAFRARAVLTLTYKGAEKTVEILYADSVLYLTVDGLHVKANIEEALALISEYVDLPSADGDAMAIVKKILALDFGQLVSLREADDTLTLTLAGSELLKALGIDFNLGDVVLTVGGGRITASAYGATVSVEAGEAFTFSTDGYAELVKYARKLIDIYKSGWLRARLLLEAGGLALTGTVNFDLTSFNTEAVLTLSYGKESKDITILYTEGGIYLAVDGIRVLVNAEQALTLLSGLLDMDTSDKEATDLLTTILALDFSEIVPELWESNDILHVTLSSELLFGLFGLDFDLGDIRIAVSERGVTVKLSMAEITVAAGEPFTPDTDDYIDITDYILAVAELAKAKYFTVGISYTGEKLTVFGTLDIAKDGSSAQGTFTLKYNGAEHEIYVLYTADETVYLAFDGIKVKANLAQAVDLVRRLITKAKGAQKQSIATYSDDLTEEERGIIERILSFNLSELFTLTEKDDVLSLAVDGTKLLESLGASFDLGEVTVEITKKGEISLYAFEGDFLLTLGAGEAFEAQNPEDYIDLIKYADYLIALFENRTYEVGISYEGGDLKVKGVVSFDTKSKVAEGALTLVYRSAEKEASFIYEAGYLYLTLGSFKLKAETGKAVALLAAYLGLSDTDGVEFETLEKIFSVDFDTVLYLSEDVDGDTLTVLVKGTELLEALGADFALGDVAVQIGEGYLYASVFGIALEVHGNKNALTVGSLTGYTDVSAYVNSLVELLKNNFLQINLHYAADGLSVDGLVLIDIKGRQVRGEFTLASNGTTVKLGVVYAEGGMLYLNLDGAKVKVNISDAIDFVKALANGTLPATYALTNSEVQPTALTPKQADLIEKILTLNLDDFFTLAEEEGTLTVVLAGTELIRALFGKEVNLGDIEISVTEGMLTLTVLDAEITLTPAEAFVTNIDENEYIDILEYVKWAAQIFTSPYLTAEVTLGVDDLSIDAVLDISVDGSFVRGNVAITYLSAVKELGFLYVVEDGLANGMIYLDIDGIRIKVTAEKVASLVSGLMAELAGKEPGAEQYAFMRTAFESFGLFTLFESAEKDLLTLTVNGTKLLELFGADFELGDVTVNISQESFSLGIDGKFTASVKLTKSEKPFVLEDGETDGYVDVFHYTDMVRRLFTDYPTLNVELETEIGTAFGNIALSVNLKFNKDFTYAEGKLLLGGLNIEVIYIPQWNEGRGKDDILLYLTIGKLKVSANVTEAIELIQGMLPAQLKLSDAGRSKLERVLAIPFGEILELNDRLEHYGEGEALLVTLRTTALFEALGLGFDLGEVTLLIEEGQLSATVKGAEIVLYGTSRKITPKEPEGYADITPIIGRLCDLLREQAIEFSGELSVGDDFNLIIEKGVFSWANDTTRLYLRAYIGETRLLLSLEGGYVKLAVGSIGVEFTLDDVSNLIDAVKALIERVKSTLDSVKENVSGEFDKDALIATLEAIVNLLKGSSELAASAAETQIATLAGNFEIGNDPKNKEIITVTIGAFTLSILDETDESGKNDDGYTTSLGFLGITFGYTGEKIKVSGALHTGVFYENELTNPFPQITDATLYKLSELVDLLDYVGAAIDLVTEQSLNITLEGSVTSTDTQVYTSGVKYTLTGNMDYYAGASFPIHLDMDGNNLWINTDLYLHVTINMIAGSSEVSNLWIDILILDAAPDGSKDDVLDFYISISKVGEGNEGYDPLKLYAPADELSVVLASVGAMFGLDAAQLVNEYLISRLDLTTTAQLRGMGLAFMPLISKLLDKFGGKEGDAEKALINQLVAGYELPLEEVGGEFTFGDVKLRLKKEYGDDGLSRLTLLAVENAWNKDKTEKTDLAFAIKREEIGNKNLPSYVSGYFSVLGVDTLIHVLANSTTHGVDGAGNPVGAGQKPDHYEMNENFYIDGTANLSLALGNWNIRDIEIRVKGVSVDLDKSGDVVINVRLEYDAQRMTLAGLLGDSVIIKGDSALDLTINLQDKMLYMRREQYTEYDGSNEIPLANPEIIYRVVPLSNFMADYMNHICFMFNLSETIINRIMDMVGSGSPTAPTTDLGDAFRRYISSCTYNPASNGSNSWTMKLNGAGLTGSDSFSDIVVTIGSDAQDILRTLDVSLSIASVVNISAALGYRNPKAVMDDGVVDLTTNIEGTVRDGMSAVLESVDWSVRNYVEGRSTYIYYRLPDETLVDTQLIFYDYETKRMFAPLRFPSLDDYQTSVGYEYYWDESVEAAPNLTLYAKSRARTFVFLFESEEYIDGFAYGTDGIWRLTYEWTFGTEFVLPFAKTQEKQVVGFTNGSVVITEGNYAEWDWLREGNLTFKAQWEYIEYTVTFDHGNGTLTTQKGHFGDEIVYPANPEKTGYTFRGWSSEPETITGDITLTALFEANTYTVTLVSEHEIAGFTEKNGRYEYEIKFVYDTLVELPNNLRTEDGFYILNGFMREGDAALYVEYLPNVTADTEFTAVWREVGFDIVFVDESGSEIARRNMHRGETFKQEDLPAVPEKAGYTGAWDIPADYTVQGPDTIRPVYTPITYYVTLQSEFELVDFTYDLQTRLWTYTVSFAFDENGSLSLARYGMLGGNHTFGYAFEGFYLASGEKVEHIDAALIRDVFAFNVGDGESKNVLTARRIDNNVVARLYSDIEFEGGTRDIDISKGYYYEFDTNYNATYRIDYTMVPAGGYQQLGYWYNDPVTGWRRVTSLEEFAGRTDVEIYAMWIQNINVELTQLYITYLNLGLIKGSRYNIGGTVTGGQPAGAHSKEIYDFTGMVKTTQAKFMLHGNGKTDSPDWGNEFKIEYDENNVGTFLLTEQNSWTFQGTSSLYPEATHGGVVLQATFTYGGESISTIGGSVMSFATYTVRYLNMAGEVVATVNNVRAGYTGTYTASDFSGFDFSNVPGGVLNLGDTVYADELAAKNGIAVPPSPVEGRTTRWPHLAIAGNLDVRPVYDYNPVEITFRSDYQFSGAWIAETEGGNFTGKYVYTAWIRPESVLEIIANGAVYKTYTVLEGENSVFEIPAASELPKAGGVRPAYWDEGSVAISEYGATFTALYAPDKLIYYSALSFDVTAEGTRYTINSNTEYEVEYQSTYTLIVPDGNAVTIDGVVWNFLGWYTKDASGVWSKMPASVDITASEEPTYIHALWWANNVTIAGAAATRKDYGKSSWLGWSNSYYTYETEVTISGGQFAGAFAAEIAGEMTLQYILHYGTIISRTETLNTETVAYQTNYNSGEIRSSNSGNSIDVSVNVVYRYSGSNFSLSDVLSSAGFVGTASQSISVSDGGRVTI